MSEADTAFSFGLDCCGIFFIMFFLPHTPLSVSTAFLRWELMHLRDEQKSGLLGFHDQVKLGS